MTMLTTPSRFSRFCRLVATWTSLIVLSTYLFLWSSFLHGRVVYEDDRRNIRGINQADIDGKQNYNRGQTFIESDDHGNISSGILLPNLTAHASPGLPVSPTSSTEVQHPSDGNQIFGLCSSNPPFLIGRISPEVLNIAGSLKAESVFKSFPEISSGGHWQPETCIPQHSVAVIIPYRNRPIHLYVFLSYLIPILKRQLLQFFFIVVEQQGTELFNKGRLLNAGFRLAESVFQDQRFKVGQKIVLFHDVDMVPEDDRNMYSCPEAPRHLSPYTDTLKYELWYHNLVGGALCFQMNQFRKVNGYSNEYWGWGGEDDDMGNRILTNGFAISRPSALIGRYRMFYHRKRHDEAYPKRYDLLATSKTRWRSDGLREHKWKVLQVNQTQLYYHMLVDVGPMPKQLYTAATTTQRSLISYKLYNVSVDQAHL